MKIRFRKRVLAKYLISYLTLALILCITLGSVLSLISARELNNTAEEAQIELLKAASNDLAQQLQIIDDLALKIKTSIYYQTFYLSLSPLNAIELISDFSHSGNYAPTISDFFLFYTDDDVVYSESAKYTFRQFASFYLFSENERTAEEMRSILLNRQTRCTGLLNHRGNHILTTHLVIGRAASKAQAILMYSFDAEAARTRLKNLYQLDSGYRVLLDGTLILGEEPAEGKETLSGFSADGSLQCVINRESAGIIDKQMQYQQVAFICILFVLAAAVVLSVYLARRSYRPIRNLARKLDSDPESGSYQDEISRIEQAMEDIMHQDSNRRKQMNSLAGRISELNGALRQTLLLLLINGEHDEKLLHYLKELGIRMEHPYFVTVWIPFRPDPEPEAMQERIDDLNDETQSLLLTQLPGQWGYAVIINMASYTQMDALEDSLRKKLGNDTYHVGSMCDSVAYLGNSFTHAVMQVEWSDTKHDSLLGKTDKLERLEKAIRDSNPELAREVLQEILENLRTVCPTSLIQRSLYRELGFRIAEYGKELRRPIPDLLIQDLARALDIRTCSACLLTLTERICTRQTEEAETASEEEQKLLSYLDEHALENDLSMELVSEDCCMSARQVNQILRARTGSTFREYLYQLRMKHASEMLKSGLTINETAHAVGYADVSYFIKLFRKTTDMTPGQYQAEHRRDI